MKIMVQLTPELTIVWCHPNNMQQTRENYLNIMIDLAENPILVDWYYQMTGKKYPDDDRNIIDNFVNKLENAEYFLS